MPDTQNEAENTPETATERPLTPLEKVRQTQKTQRDNLKAARTNQSVQDTEQEEGKRSSSDNPSTSNPRFTPQRELG